MRALAFAIVVTSLAMWGCSTLPRATSDGSETNPDDAKRMATYDALQKQALVQQKRIQQLQDEYEWQLARNEKIADRMEKLVGRWERQADREDAILTKREHSR